MKKVVLRVSLIFTSMISYLLLITYETYCTYYRSDTVTVMNIKNKLLSNEARDDAQVRSNSSKWLHEVAVHRSQQDIWKIGWYLGLSTKRRCKLRVILRTLSLNSYKICWLKAEMRRLRDTVLVRVFDNFYTKSERSQKIVLQFYILHVFNKRFDSKTCWENLGVWTFDIFTLIFWNDVNS